MPILIPCHRVNRGDGSIGQYGFGPEMKRDLLTHEGLDPDRLESDAERGVRLTGSDTTSIYCWPTCRHAKRTTAHHRVEFRSDRDAVAAGYRACKVCRPPSRRSSPPPSVSCVKPGRLGGSAAEQAGRPSSHRWGPCPIVGVRRADAASGVVELEQTGSALAKHRTPQLLLAG